MLHISLSLSLPGIVIVIYEQQTKASEAVTDSYSLHPMVHSHYHVNHHMTSLTSLLWPFFLHVNIGIAAVLAIPWPQRRWHERLRHHAEADHRGSPWFTKLLQFHVITRWIVWLMHVCARYIGLIHLQLGGLSLQNTLGIHVGPGIQGVLWPHPSFPRLRPRGRNCKGSQEFNQCS